MAWKSNSTKAKTPAGESAEVFMNKMAGNQKMFGTNDTSRRPQRVHLYDVPYCVTFAPTGPTGVSDLDYFDVPREIDTEGNLTGIRLAWEVLQVESSGRNPGILQSVLQGAFAAFAAPYNEANQGRVGAAIGFIETICAIASDAVASHDMRSTVAARLDSHERDMLADLREAQSEISHFKAAMRPPTQRQHASA